MMCFSYFIDEFVRASYLLGTTDSYPKEEKKNSKMRAGWKDFASLAC